MMTQCEFGSPELHDLQNLDQDLEGIGICTHLNAAINPKLYRGKEKCKNFYENRWAVLKYHTSKQVSQPQS